MRRERVYLGGRFVLGSGRTWPHDFLFLEDFFSLAEPGVDGISGRLRSARSARSVRSDPSAFSSPDDLGVIISSGFMVEEAGVEAKSGGYMSLGVDRKDSAGEFSNGRFGDVVVASQESMIMNCGGGRRRSWDVFCCAVVLRAKCYVLGK